MDRTLRPYLAELVGAFVLVAAGAGAVCASFQGGPGEPRLGVTGIALAEGCALALALTAAAHYSVACFNPALALMLWVCKRLDGRRTLALVFCQLVGAVLGGLVVYWAFGGGPVEQSRLGTPHLGAAIRGTGGLVTFGDLAAGTAVEAGLTALVAFALFATLIDPRAPKIGGLGVGLAQTAAVLVGYHLTGGSANPARYFGSVVWELAVPSLRGATPAPLADHTVYWVGPVVGALVGGLVYGAVILPPEKGRGVR